MTWIRKPQQNTAAFRLSKASRSSGIDEPDLRSAMMYALTPASHRTEFLGLTPRYNSLTARSGANILDAGGTGSDNTSIWLVVWANTVTVSAGHSTGLLQRPGRIDAFDEDGKPLPCHGEIWEVEVRPARQDWRYAVRIANVDVSDMTGQTGTQAVTAGDRINKLMIEGAARIPSRGMGCDLHREPYPLERCSLSAHWTRARTRSPFTDAVNQFGNVAQAVTGQAKHQHPSGQLRFLGVRC